MKWIVQKKKTRNRCKTNTTAVHTDEESSEEEVGVGGGGWAASKASIFILKKSQVSPNLLLHCPWRHWDFDAAFTESCLEYQWGRGAKLCEEP